MGFSWWWNDMILKWGGLFRYPTIGKGNLGIIMFWWFNSVLKLLIQGYGSSILHSNHVVVGFWALVLECYSLGIIKVSYLNSMNFKLQQVFWVDWQLSQASSSFSSTCKHIIHNRHHMGHYPRSIGIHSSTTSRSGKSTIGRNSLTYERIMHTRIKTKRQKLKPYKCNGFVGIYK